MTNALAKTHVQTVKVQLREQPGMQYGKDERFMSKETKKTGLPNNGVSMIETMISASILVFMSIVFKVINAKQREFDQLEHIRK